MLLIDTNRNLLSYAEVGEDVTEDFGGGDGGAGDFAEMGDAEAGVFADEVGGDAGTEGREGTLDVGEGLLKDGLVAGVDGGLTLTLAHGGMSNG